MVVVWQIVFTCKYFCFPDTFRDRTNVILCPVSVVLRRRDARTTYNVQRLFFLAMRGRRALHEWESSRPFRWMALSFPLTFTHPCFLSFSFPPSISLSFFLFLRCYTRVCKFVSKIFTSFLRYKCFDDETDETTVTMIAFGVTGKINAC